jgi:hypothetical protein
MKGMRRARAAMVFGIGCVMAASACDDDSPVDPVLGDGEYRLVIDGDVKKTLTGDAFFGVEEDENGEEVFAILFGSDDDDDVVMVGVSGTTRPSTGTYKIEEGEIEPGDWVGLYAFGDGEELEGFMVADSGTVVVTRSDAGVMKGSVLLYLSGFIEGSLGEAVVEGDFDARPAPSSE